MTITTVGIDLAKNVFAVHCVDQHGKTVLVKPKVSRAVLPELIASFPPCVIGMEAFSGAHYWARLFRQYGHAPRLMAAKFVSPYRMAGKSGKNDALIHWLSVRQFVARICGLYQGRMKASRRCDAYTVPDKVL